MYSSEREIIRAAVALIPEVEKSILFGSRARGDADPASDWDVLVVVRSPLSFEKKFEIEMQIRSAIAGRVIPVDILIASSEEARTFQEFPGSVIRHALSEGVLL
jgi:predicted nucleotidyltransferase